ncbi:MAG: MBL fold metallo-hydrolase [Spirochaetes bacterium]|nr:MBL fold metallo-hydrolase [Spirochaetota bacterium]MBU1081265.1 MBL fold metallo-hydrolase [Spirochaetota bacterium]
MIRSFSVGPIGENVYIIENPGAPLVIVDPGAEPDRILSEALAAIARSSAPSVIVALTHGHLDHVAGLPGLLSGFAAAGTEVKTYAPEGDRDYFGERAKATNERVFTSIGAMAFFRKHWIDMPEADVYFGHGFSFPGTDVVALHTPGHTRGSSCFLAESASSLMAGDTLFRDGRGRTDNFDADEATIVHSIRERLCPLHDAVRVWPGHGEQTTIGHEKRYYR